jgi:uncharacterized protein (TIGR02646 family)
MIRVNRGQPPKNYGRRAKALRERFKVARENDPCVSAATFWASVRHDLRDDASELARRFHFKCAYCESRMGHVSYPRIEHYKPKGQKRFEKLMFDWGNWLLSCGVCNDEKWRDFPERDGAPLLLDPTVDEPRNHLRFRRNIILPLSNRGNETIRLVGLTRHDLEMERGSWLLQIDTLLLVMVFVGDIDVRRESREALIWAMQGEAPYAAMTRQYLTERCPEFANPPVPHPLVVHEDMQQKIAGLVVKHQDAVCCLV